MISNYKIILILFLLLNYSCSKEDALQLMNIPTNQLIDINEDQINDLEVIYDLASVDNLGNAVKNITGAIKPLSENKLLSHNSLGGLFLRSGDTIKQQNNSMSDWISNPLDILNVNADISTITENWEIISELGTDYIMGYKINDGTADKIGWMKLGFDNKTGKVSILDKALSTASEIIIP